MQSGKKLELLPNDQLDSTLLPNFKNEGNIHECGNYRGIKLLSQMVKCLERMLGESICGAVVGRRTVWV